MIKRSMILGIILVRGLSMFASQPETNLKAPKGDLRRSKETIARSKSQELSKITAAAELPYVDSPCGGGWLVSPVNPQDSQASWKDVCP